MKTKKQKTVTLWNVHRQNNLVSKTFTINPNGSLESRGVEENDERLTYYRDYQGAVDNGWRRTPQRALEDAIDEHCRQISTHQMYLRALRRAQREVMAARPAKRKRA